MIVRQNARQNGILMYLFHLVTETIKVLGRKIKETALPGNLMTVTAHPSLRD